MTTIIRRTIPAEFVTLGDREVQVTMSTSARARDGHILESGGCVLDSYRANPIVLWTHDPLEPVGNNADLDVQADRLSARTTFAPAGISPTADKICGLVKSGVIRAASIGFVILEGEPIDPARPRAGIRATKWELLEMSYVSVPADAGAIVTARAHEIKETSMPASDDENGRALAVKRTRMLTAEPKLHVRGLYDVACLAHMLEHLGYIHGSAVWESEVEADDSKVPAMLGEALKGLGETLIAMTTEEVNELLTGKGLEEIPAVEDVVVIEERSFVAAGKTPAIRAWRQGRAAMQLRAGKAISHANAAKIDQAAGHLSDAADRAKEAAGHTGTAIEHGEALADLHGKAAASHDKMNAAVEAANGSAPAEVADKIAKVQQHHKALGKHLAAIGERCAALGDVQADAQGSIAGAQRCMRSAIRCVRSVTDADGDTDSKDVQTSDGDGDSDGSKNGRAFSADWRRRQAALLELSVP